MEDTSEANPLLTLAVLEDALSVPELRPGALQLFEALAMRATARPVRACSLPSGTFLARVHAASAGAGKSWDILQPSYTFKRRKDISSATVVAHLVSAIDATSGDSVSVVLNSELCASLATTGGVFGWAELWTGGGACLVHEWILPLRTLAVPPGTSGQAASMALAGATGVTLANIVQASALCDDDGARRLLAVALVILLPAASVREAMAEEPAAATGLLQEWQASLAQKALLPLLLSQEQANKAILKAQGTPPPHTSAPPDQPQYRPRGPPSSRRAGLRAPGLAAPDRADSPGTFKWCSNCRFTTHGLRNCFSVAERLQNMAARGNDTSKFIAKLLKEHKSKWIKKGPDFAAYFEANQLCSADHLRAKLPE